MSPKETAYIVERLAVRFMSMVADYERKLAEHRASFGERTEADEKIIEGLRAEIIRVNEAHGRTKVENDGLLDELAAQRDAFTAEVAALKSQTPKHPAKVGEWVKRLTPSPMTPAGGVAKVTDVFEVLGLAVKIERPDGIKGTWWAKSCEPCDPPEATHDTEAGKAAAEAVLKTEPVADEIKIGNVVKVCSASGDNTARSDIGKIGEVIEIYSQDGTVLLSGGVGWVSRCDVRKVMT